MGAILAFFEQARVWLALLVILTLALVWPGYGGRWFRRGEGLLSRFARSQWACLGLAVGLFLFSCGLALLMWLPAPMVHDEFSYLLQADTFAHGRLANPPHLLWRFFENFHIIQHPTYASKYPPGQGLFLALGQVLSNPIEGVWISTALAGAAVFWMLSALFPKPWALAGALLAILSPQVFAWNWCYWGGSVALL